MSERPSKASETQESRYLLKHGEQAMRELLEAFSLMAQGLQEGELPSKSLLAAALTANAKARTVLIEEIQKYERSALASEGRDGNAPLDLEAIRADIGSKIDRIRRAGTGDRVSEEPGAE